MAKKKHIFLIGFMGVGKSTVSSELSRLSKQREIDTDAQIVKEQKMTIPELFEKKGEAYFRNCETDLLERLKQTEEALIVSCGGGMAMRKQNAALMKESGIVVWITATPETILERVCVSQDRPILRGNMNVEFITELMKQRQKKYETAADMIIHTDNRTVEEICREIMSKAVNN